MPEPLQPQPFQEHERISFAFPGSGFTAAVAATGLITCATNANMADTDFITIGDGMNPAVLYEYDKSANGVTAGRVNWAAGATSAADVAATLKTAIDANQPGITVTDNLDGTLTLTHKWPGLGGNVTITEAVTHASFTVAGMSGGLAEVATGLTSTTTYKFETVGGTVRFDKIEIFNPTGFAAHGSAYWTLALKAGTKTLGTWSTLSSAEGTITADVAALMTLAATDTNRIGAAGDVMSLVITKTGSPAAFPPGRITAHARRVA